MKRHFRLHGKVVLASLLALLILSLGSLASSATLHELIHTDADSATHQCAATMFAHGQVDSPVLEMAAFIPPVPAEYFPLTSTAIFNALTHTLPPSCGPPVSSFNS